MELDKHIKAVESHRAKLIYKFKLAVFNVELKRNNLPSSNPINVVLVDYWRRIKKIPIVGELLHPWRFLLLCMAIFGSTFWIVDLVGQRSIWYNVFNIMAVVFYILLFFCPLVYWVYGLYRTIKLTFYTDYLKKNILRDLDLLINYYSLLLSVAKPDKKEIKTLENGIEEMKEFGKSFSKPKFFRNLTFGSLSSGAGILGIITTLVADEYPLIGQISFEGYWFLEDLPTWGPVLAFIVPLIVVPTLVVIPLILGIRGSSIYADRKFEEIKKIKEAMRESYLFLERSEPLAEMENVAET